MLSIHPATIEDIPVIQHLTNIIWPATYSSILSGEQLAYMLDIMYSRDALINQMENQHHRFLLCYDGTEPVGFASFGHIGDNVFKLHKIYVLPNQQGKGVGKFIIEHIKDAILPQGAVALDLNVNRQNSARGFYERIGFTILRNEDIDIGRGYWMNDYVMRRVLVN
jgi:GNAT superfamily N-acetyltransferase